MNVIFLDVDGVLNNAHTTDRVESYIGIDDNKVILLKQVVDYFDAKIVLSSTWRHEVDNHIAKYLTGKLEKQGLKIYDITPNIGWYVRAKEIATWLADEHEYSIENIIILDDEYFNWYEYQLEQYWVPTEYYSENGGLTTDIVNDIINNKERFIYNKEG